MVKNILKTIGMLIGVVLLAICVLLAWLSFNEYKPAPEEPLEVVSNIDGEPTKARDLSVNESISILSWNMGYGALGDNADFFMDGGESVMTADLTRVNANTMAVIEYLKSQNPDVVFLQEADQDSKRSQHVDEVAKIRKALNKKYQSTFANNYKVSYVPYPVPTLGKVDSGLLTLSKFKVSGATRVSLPCPFSWPVRTMNLKRCLMVDRIPLLAEGSPQELVLINLHLEAYDSGEGKIAQTKALRKVLEEEYAKGNYVIAGGDFNQTFSNVNHSLYPVLAGKWEPGKLKAKPFKKNWALLMDPTAPTCRSLDRPLEGLTPDEKDPTEFQYYMIDGFIVSKNLEIQQIKHRISGSSSRTTILCFCRYESYRNGTVRYSALPKRYDTSYVTKYNAAL